MLFVTQWMCNHFSPLNQCPSSITLVPIGFLKSGQGLSCISDTFVVDMFCKRGEEFKHVYVCFETAYEVFVSVPVSHREEMQSHLKHIVAIPRNLFVLSQKTLPTESYS